MPTISTAKLIGFGVGVIAVLGFVFLALSWRSERNALRDWQAVTLAATRDAVANPKLKARDVPQQVRLLGQAVAGLKSSIARQNAEIDRLDRLTAEQQRNAAEAAQAARTRAKAADRASGSLIASSRSSERLAKPCEPSEALKEAWR